MEPLSVAYLLEETGLSGGARVIAAHADALIARGHHAAIVTRGSELTWRASSAEWIFVDDFAAADFSRFEFVVAGFWTTVEPAFAAAGARAIHFCQGYEGSFTAYEDLRPQIDAAYRLVKPKIVVSPHLVEVCRPFSTDVTWIGQIVDDAFFQSGAGGNERPRVLLPGAFEIDFKGVDVGYGAAAHARYCGADFDLVRVSPWRPSGAEPMEHVAEFHVGLNTAEMARLLLSCDILLAPSRKEEGFGLPAAEAMASGVPVAMTRIPSFLSFDGRHDYALFAEEEDAGNLGDALMQLLDDADLRHDLIGRGREVAEQFRSDRTGERLERYLLGRRDGGA
jgi:glycosyltransferase involved in cell wall biosynthesis